MQPLYKINPQLVIQQQKDSLSLFDPDHSVLFTLNDTALFIFKKINSGKKKDEIVALLVKKYAVTPKQAEKDIDSLIRQLLKQNIIKEK